MDTRWVAANRGRRGGTDSAVGGGSGLSGYLRNGVRSGGQAEAWCCPTLSFCCCAGMGVRLNVGRCLCVTRVSFMSAFRPRRAAGSARGLGKRKLGAPGCVLNTASVPCLVGLSGLSAPGCPRGLCPLLEVPHSSRLGRLAQDLARIRRVRSGPLGIISVS